MTVVSLDMAYRSFLEVLAGSHPPRYAASLNPSSPRFGHSSTGTRHSPGIQPADAQELIDHGTKAVVLSKGIWERL
jgi:hypothetical protein